MLQHLRIALAALLAVAVLSGCSVATKFGYNRLDWLAEREINKYVDLTDTQEDWLEPKLDALLAWHRETQLPLYARDLNALADRLMQPLDADTLTNTFARFDGYAKTVSERAMPDTIALLRGLSDRQVQHVLDKIDDDYAEYAEKINDKTEDERRDKAKERLVDWLEDKMGRLSAEQKALLDPWAAGRNDMGPINLIENKRWRDAFAVALATRQQPEFENVIRALMGPQDQTQPASYRAATEHNEALWTTAVVEVSAISTERQRKKFSKWARNYADDFADLADHAN